MFYPVIGSVIPFLCTKVRNAASTLGSSVYFSFFLFAAWSRVSDAVLLAEFRGTTLTKCRDLGFTLVTISLKFYFPTCLAGEAEAC